MCNFEDILYVEDVTDYWYIDENGDATDLQTRTSGDFKYYSCDVHGDTFGENTYDPEAAWKEVLKHMEEEDV